MGVETEVQASGLHYSDMGDGGNGGWVQAGGLHYINMADGGDGGWIQASGLHYIDMEDGGDGTERVIFWCGRGINAFFY